MITHATDYIQRVSVIECGLRVRSANSADRTGETDWSIVVRPDGSVTVYSVYLNPVYRAARVSAASMDLLKGLCAEIGTRVHFSPSNTPLMWVLLDSIRETVSDEVITEALDKLFQLRVAAASV